MSETTAEPSTQPADDDKQAQQMLGDAVAAGQFLNRPQQTPPPAAPAQPEGDGKTATDGEQGKDWETEASKWKALARQHENKHLGALGFKSKDEIESLRQAAQKYAEIEEAQKTEIQKATERAQTVEQQLADMRATNARLMAAATHNIPPDLIDLLGTGSDEEINQRAEVLAERLKASTPPPSQRPVESLTPGASPASAAPVSPDAWIRGMAGRNP
ncbi:hypothetical protein [Streptomyces antimycoticus]|uniref:hypothetical protein n=1 Tax=Streptomyces antimycoticus TaxID=68175 RepID=UPI00386893EF|nr:hypothetical protein OG751_03945 [Streptomyces antimycoticus]